MQKQEYGRSGSLVVRWAGRVCLLLGMLALLACNSSSGSGPSGSLTPTPTQSATPSALPDLQIGGIDLFPAQPQAGQRFTLNVYIKNAGTAPSGAYDLALFMQDVSRGSTYPIGTFREQGMQPGEQYVVYSSQNLLVNCPGEYQLHVEIHPFLFQDGNLDNNTRIQQFTVGGSGC